MRRMTVASVPKPRRLRLELPVVEASRRPLCVTVEEFALEEGVEVHHAAALDLLAIIDAIRKRAILGAWEVEVAASHARDE